jgi:hypothetical protein
MNSTSATRVGFIGLGSPKTAGSPAELAAASDLVCVCARDDAALALMNVARA